jgi:hypothetical protein
MVEPTYQTGEQLQTKDYADLNRLFGATGPYQITFDQYGRYRQIVKKEGDQTVQYFLYVYPDGNFDVVTGTQYVAQVKKDNPGKKLDSIRESLYKGGFLEKTGYTTKDSNALTTAILKAGSTQSVEQVDSFLIDKKTKLTPFFDWTTTRPSAGIGGPTKTGVASTEADAGERINIFMQQLLDRPASAEEKKAFFNKVKAAEKLAIITRKEVGGVDVTSGSNLSEDDYRQIAFDTAKSSISKLTDEQIGIGTGALSQSISSLKEYGTQYGIQLSNREAFNQIMNGMVQGGTLSTGKLDSQQQAIKNMAKSFYPNLSQIIDNGGTVSAVADQFASKMSNILEIPAQSLNVFDKRIQKALTNNGKPGVMTLGDFEVLLRNEPEWAKTKNAKEEASSYATSILQSFGLMA